MSIISLTSAGIYINCITEIIFDYLCPEVLFSPRYIVFCSCFQAYYLLVSGKNKA